jgi:hypothetical protein
MWTFLNIKMPSSYKSILLAKYYASDQFKKNEMHGACGTYWGHDSCKQCFGGET